MRVVCVDTETHLIRRGRSVPRLVCVSVSEPGCGVQDYLAHGADYAREVPQIEGSASLWAADEGAYYVLDCLESLDAVLCLFNAPFDLWVIAEHLAERDAALGARFLQAVYEALDAGRIVDAEIRARLCAIASGTYEWRQGPSGPQRATFSLDACVAHMFGVEIAGKRRTTQVAEGDEREETDPWRLRYAELDGVPIANWPTDAREYALNDAVWPLLLARAYVQRYATVDGRVFTTEPSAAHPLGRVTAEQREVAAYFALRGMANRGLVGDPSAIAACLAEWRTASAAGVTVGEREGWVRVKGRDKGKPGSVNLKVLRARVEGAYSVTGRTAPVTAPSKTYPSGQTQTTADVLKQSLDGALVAYGESQQATLYLQRWGKVLVQAAVGPLTYGVNPTLETGRASVFDPAMQQPPRKGPFRRCFVPREGFLLCTADYTAMELAVLAQLCLWFLGYSVLAETINAGRDPHLVTAREILCLRPNPPACADSYEAMQAAYKAGDPDVIEARQIAKPVNFGFPGGMGPAGFVSYVWNYAEIVISGERASELRDAWFRAYPEMRSYFRHVQRLWEVGTTIEQAVSGRIRHCERITQAWNTLFQGLGADGAKYGAHLLVRAGTTGTSPRDAPAEVRSAARVFHGSRPVLFLHDEILSEVPVAYASEAAEAQSVIMTYAMSRHVPDVRCPAEPVLLRRWLKGARPTRNAAGRLIVTEET